MVGSREAVLVCSLVQKKRKKSFQGIERSPAESFFPLQTESLNIYP